MSSASSASNKGKSAEARNAKPEGASSKSKSKVRNGGRPEVAMKAAQQKDGDYRPRVINIIIKKALYTVLDEIDRVTFIQGGTIKDLIPQSLSLKNSISNRTDLLSEPDTLPTIYKDKSLHDALERSA